MLKLHQTTHITMSGNPTAIVVPCFNEEHRFDSLEFAKFVQHHSNIRFVLVDDGSTDGTWSVLKTMSVNLPRSFSAIRLAENRGKAEAVRAGLLAALKSRPQYIGYWDADLATPLAAIHSFRRVLNHRSPIQAVIGCRIHLLGRSIHRNPWRRRLGKSFVSAASIVLGQTVNDTQCGAKLFRVTPELTAILATPFSSAWIFDVELIRRLQVLLGDSFSESIYELPLESWFERPGSKLRPKHFARAFQELLSIHWQYTGSRLKRYQASLRGLMESQTNPDWQGSQSEVENSSTAPKSQAA